MDFDAQKLEELSRRFHSSPGRILDLIIELRNRGCPPEMLDRALLDELLIVNLTRVTRAIIILVASCNATVFLVFIFFQINFLPKNYRYDEVLKTIIGWGFFGVFCSILLAVLSVVFCRKLIEVVNLNLKLK